MNPTAPCHPIALEAPLYPPFLTISKISMDGAPVEYWATNSCEPVVLVAEEVEMLQKDWNKRLLPLVRKQYGNAAVRIGGCYSNNPEFPTSLKTMENLDQALAEIGDNVIYEFVEVGDYFALWPQQLSAFGSGYISAAGNRCIYIKGTSF